VSRARALAEFLGAPIAIIDKRRTKPNVAEIMNIIGDVKGKKCILIDDMIDTAGTISLGAQALMDQGAEEVYASCTHPVLSGPAIERLENSPIKEVVVTDSINLPKEKQIDKLVQVSVGPLLGAAIKRINENKPVSPLFKKRFDMDQAW
jgi:ribose-phosphate pyrophosphokinase